MAIIAERAQRVKEDPSWIVEEGVVRRACVAARHRWRKRTLDPTTTLRVFVAQVACGNTAITHLTRIMGEAFSPSAYAQARQRLPVRVVQAVLHEFDARARGASEDRSGLWRGHRLAILDGTGLVMPDTPELRSFFGVASVYAPGCGLPRAHVLTLFDAHAGFLLDMAVDRGTTQDLRRAHDLHRALREGDVVIGDRGLCAYTHLFALSQKKMHGVFRAGASWNIPFPAGKGPRPRHAYNRHHTSVPLLVRSFSPDDQLIEIVKPHNRAKHLDPAWFATVPAKMVVRVVRFRVRRPGFRAEEVLLLTTLLDAKAYPASEIADLYLTRWRIEQNIRHLKRTLGMERLKCKSKAGIERELLVFALVYNAVCAVRVRAATAQEVEPLRISFLDTLRWLLFSSRHAPTQLATPPPLLILPLRPPRHHPRQRKRSDSPFPIMKQPRSLLVRLLNRSR